jgi:hypothetical protein
MRKKSKIVRTETGKGIIRSEFRQILEFKPLYHDKYAHLLNGEPRGKRSISSLRN